MSSSLFSQLDLGKRALIAQQSGMSVAGHNIANVNNDDYSRQRVELAEQHPRKNAFGVGADFKGVKRLADRFTQGRLIGEQARAGQLGLREKTLNRLERVFNEMDGHGLRKSLAEFWDGWAHLATNPESEVYRQELLSRGEALTERYHSLGNELTSLRRELNGSIAERVEKLNQLAEQLARANATVQQTERGRGESNDVRDEREKVLKTMSQLAPIDWFEDDAGLVHVGLGNGWPLVNGREHNKLEASLKSDEMGMFRLRGLEKNGVSRDITDYMKTGELGEIFQLRDHATAGYQEKMDKMAQELAYQVNKIHATGTGINSSRAKLQSSFALKADGQAKPMPFLKTGEVTLKTVDKGGQIDKTYKVQIEAGTDTLAAIVDKINQAVTGGDLLARMNPDGSVNLESDGAHTFIFGQDNTDFAVVMGFNNFFETLHGASDIHINETLKAKSNWVSTGHDLVPGDNSAALAVNGLQFAPTMEGQSVSFDEYYNGMLTELGVTMARAKDDKHAQDLVVDQFKKMRDEISSVNMDEELSDLVAYQRGFDAAAKFVSTVDEMTQAVMKM